MKSLFVLLIAVVALFSSCQKQNVDIPVDDQPVTMIVSFDALEQVNVSHYKVEVSADGVNFKEMLTILTEDGVAESKYANLPIDVTEFKGNIYARVKSFDKAGNVSTFKVFVVR
jgi:hypothetical protein